MIQLNRTAIIKATFAAILGLVITSVANAGNPLEIKSDRLSLKFAADGKPKSFRIGGKELLDEQNPGTGFELKGFDYNSCGPASFSFQNLAFDGKQLTASIGDHVRITFEVTATDRYLAFKLSRVEGVPKNNLLWLKFTMNVQGDVKTLPLGYMTKASGKGCEVSWPWLWARTPDTPMGGFAIFESTSGEDVMFRHVWATEGLARPKVTGPWNWETAQKYFAAAQQRFADPSHLRMAAAVAAATGTPVMIGSDQLCLKFAADGTPGSFLVGGKERLNAQDPGKGFVLNGFDFNECKPVSFPLKNLRFDGNQLTASIGDNVRVCFDVKATDRYITFKLTRVEGVPQKNLTWMAFKMNVQGNVKVLALDYMAHASANGCTINWNWLWNRNANSILGGFAIYSPTSDADEDETLLQLWANEGLPHPKVHGEWNLQTARKWLADWQTQFADQSQMLITAKSNEELYSLADYATTMDIKRIYMHTDTWRGEYWPVKYSFLHLNPQTFPKGEEDFQKFAKYARAKGIGLTIHTVSCSIANEDPDYVVGKIDPRLARWIDGTLAQPAAAADQTLYFRPAPGQELPLTMDRPVTGPAHVDPWNNIKTVRIGNELVRVGKFVDTDKDVWQLQDCTRGAFKTAPCVHPAAVAMAGLIRPYDQVFTADNDSTLVEELGRRIAEFNNRNNIIHCEQDAGEIHTVNHQWGYAKFAKAVYTNLDHPVTSNNSGGSPMPCQFEYKFHSSKAAIAARNQPQVPLTVARGGRLATGPYEMFSLVGKPVASGVTSVGIYKPEPMFGVSSESLKSHGLSSYAASTVLAWKKVAPLLNAPQQKSILAATDQVIYRAEKSQSGYQVTPLRMLYRPGIDIGWKAGSEFGPVVPRQYVKTGSTMEIENPYPAQEPEFVIRVMNGFSDSPAAPINDKSRADATGSKDQGLIDQYNTGTGLKTAEHPFRNAFHIWAGAAVTDGQANGGKCWFRKHFKWSKSADARVDLICQADDDALLWVNGQKVRGTDGDWHIAYASEITKLLKAGDNVVAVEATNGGGGPGCLTAAIVMSGGAATETIATDKTWRTSATTQNQWKESGFDDSRWQDAAELKRFGEAIWGKATVSFGGTQKTLLQPKADKIRDLGDHQFSDDGDALRIQFENKRDAPVTHEENLPAFDCSANMSEARGIGLTVTGDGSGAVLVLQAFFRGERDYIVPLDFKGPRDIVIPCGEVSWTDARWGWYMRTKGAEYGKLGKMAIGLGKVPPKTSVDIKVSKLRILPEVPTALNNPTIHVGAGLLQITGTIPSESYVWYQGGNSLGVYDLNWQKTADLPLKKRNFSAPQGRLNISLECKEANPTPWLECQFFVKDTPMIVGVEK
ncbi:MAG: hypothetical protein WCJ14_01030 [Verrucomicrobiota bacterium]